MDNLTILMVEGLQLQDGVLLSVSGAPHLTGIQACRPHSTRPGGRTHITDAGLTSLPGLKELAGLDVSGAHVTDNGLQTIGMLTGIESLGVSATDITDRGLKSIAPLSRLKRLGVGETAVTDEGLRQIVAQHPHLQSLAVGGSAVTAAGLEALKGVAELGSIQLDSSQLTQQSCAVLSSLPIRIMQIDGTSTKPGHLSGLPEIRMLFVEGAENLTIAPGGLAGLQVLYLRGAGATATQSFFRHFPTLPKLEQLEVSTGSTESGAADVHRPLHVDDDLMQHVASLRDLKFFWLAARQLDLGDRGIAALAPLTSLEGLLLPETKITDAGVAHLAALVNLKRVRMGGEGITNAALEHFKNLKGLRELNFFNTQIDPNAAAQLKADLPDAIIQAYRIE
jgi:hypothetical protein